MRKAGLSVFVLSLFMVLVSACGNSSPDPYGVPLAGASAIYGGASQTFAGTTGVANGGTIVATAGNVAIGTGGRVTGAGGKASGGTTTGAGGKAGTTTANGGNSGSATTGGKSGSTTTGGKGGVAGSGKAGAGGSTTEFFPKTYNSACVGDANFGTTHYPDQECLGCHRGWPFAGMVFQSNGSTGAKNVEIGVKSGSNFYSTCTSRSGGMFLLRSGTISWSNAEVRIRNSKGEKASMHSGGNLSGRCNAGGTCHGSDKLIEP